jgi:hypothetical protein
MGHVKYASFAILEAEMADGGARRVQASVKTAHRHEFVYEPRPNFLYVRSRAISSRCNDNYDEFPADEIKQAWRTFIGKPVFVNHHNDDHRNARGVIIDAALHEDTNPDGSPDTWVEVLMEVDAASYPKLAQAILAGHIDRTSMGTDVAFSVCSFCGNKAATPLDYCKHIPKLKGQRIRRRTASGTTEDVLVREVCYGLRFFENSLLVEDPADPTAFFLGVDDRGVGGGYTGGLKTASKTAVIPSDDVPGRNWDESEHPRDKGGQFTDGPDSNNGPADDGKAKPEPDDAPAPGQEQDPTEAPAEGGWEDPSTTGVGTAEDPVQTSSVVDAAKALAEGKHVNLAHARQVSTLLGELKKRIDAAKAQGDKLDIDLCSVTVQNTNLFCVESKGIPRIQMPQLKVAEVPPDSRAAQEVKPTERGEYDIQPLFLEHLRSKGLKTVSTTVQASVLKATQNQLNAGKIAGMTDALLQGKDLGDEPIFVSNDDYIVDGHHRWAGNVAADWADGDDDDMVMSVHVIDMGIIDLLAEANAFAEQYGIKPQGVTASKKPCCAPCAAKEARLAKTAAGTPWVPVPKLKVGDAITNISGGRGDWVITRIEDDVMVTFDGQMGRRLFFAEGLPNGISVKNDEVWPVRKPGQRGITPAELEERDRRHREEMEAKYPSPKRRDTVSCPLCQRQVAVGAGESGRLSRHNFGRTSSPCSASGKTLAEAQAQRDEDARRSRWASRNASLDALVRLSYGEQLAPSEVDTMRTDACPVCGEKDSYDGDRCSVCNFIRPPEMFDDPDLEKAKQQDLRQEVAEDAGAPGPEALPTEGAEADPLAEDLTFVPPDNPAPADEDEAVEDGDEDEDEADDADDEDGEGAGPDFLKKKRKKKTT